MNVREQLAGLFRNFFLEKGADPADLAFLEALPLEVD